MILCYDNRHVATVYIRPQEFGISLLSPATMTVAHRFSVRQHRISLFLYKNLLLRCLSI
jgi:hypothetical protein